MEFIDPQVILFVADPEKAAAFYSIFGFRETFRTSAESPVKIELEKGGFGLGLALPGPAAQDHPISPVAEGNRACLTFWCDDADAAYHLAIGAGAAERQGPHPYLDDKLSVAFVEDLDGHPIQLVQRVR